MAGILDQHIREKVQLVWLIIDPDVKLVSQPTFLSV